LLKYGINYILAGLEGIVEEIHKRKFFEYDIQAKGKQYQADNVNKRKSKNIICFQKIPLLRTHGPGAKNKMQG